MMFEGQPFAALFLQKLSVDTNWQDVQKSQNGEQAEVLYRTDARHG